MVSYLCTVVRYFPALCISEAATCSYHAQKTFLKATGRYRQNIQSGSALLGKWLIVMEEIGASRRSWGRHPSKGSWLDAVWILFFYVKSGGFTYLFICPYIQEIFFENALYTKHYTSIWDTLGNKKGERCGLEKGASSEWGSSRQIHHISQRWNQHDLLKGWYGVWKESEMIPGFLISTDSRS